MDEKWGKRLVRHASSAEARLARRESNLRLASEARCCLK
jgi:hypothetical protein